MLNNEAKIAGLPKDMQLIFEECDNSRIIRVKDSEFNNIAGAVFPNYKGTINNTGYFGLIPQNDPTISKTRAYIESQLNNESTRKLGCCFIQKPYIIIPSADLAFQVFSELAPSSALEGILTEKLSTHKELYLLLQNRKMPICCPPAGALYDIHGNQTPRMGVMTHDWEQYLIASSAEQKTQNVCIAMAGLLIENGDELQQIGLTQYNRSIEYFLTVNLPDTFKIFGTIPGYIPKSFLGKRVYEICQAKSLQDGNFKEVMGSQLDIHEYKGELNMNAPHYFNL